MERQVKMVSLAREERRERGVKLVNQVSMEPPDHPVKLACQEELEETDMDAANSSRSTVEAVRFPRVPRTPTTFGTDSATKVTLPPMPTALVFHSSDFYARQRTRTQDGRHLRLDPDPSVTMPMMLFVEPPPHWTKRPPGRWCPGAASVRWREVC